MTKRPDLSFEGTFRPGTRVRPDADQWEPFGEVDEARLEALETLFVHSAWETGGCISEDQLDQALILPVPANEPRGMRVSAGYGYDALFALRGDQLLLVSMYPTGKPSGRYWFQLNSVDLSDDRLEMRANGILLSGPEPDAEGTSFSWFVLDQLDVRELLRKGRHYEIAIAALCYQCGIAENHVQEMPVTPEMRANWRASGIPHLLERAEEDSFTLDLSELRTLMSDDGEGGKPDDCRFRGKVLSARKLRDPLADCDGWRLQIEVIEFAPDKPLVLDFIVTEQAWKSLDPPKRGQFVEGWAWMQGYLLSVNAADGEA